jgi:transposase
MQEEYITNEAWSKMLMFLKSVPDIYILSDERCKKFIEAVYWMARTGAQWRELPERYGYWNSVFKRFNAWSKKKVWDKLFAFCVKDPDLEYFMIDATIVRAHPCAAGYGNQDEEGLGRSKGGFTTKIHAAVDALGNPLKFVITPGQRSDVTQAEKLLGNIAGAYVLGDRGYDADAIREKIKKQNCIAVIPGKSNRIIMYDYDKHIYKERSLIECFFSKIKQFRRIFSRFDKSLKSYMSMLCFVGAILWLR